MYKRKREIKALDLLKEANDYKKRIGERNNMDIYDVETLNIKDYQNHGRKNYNTKTMKTYNTSYRDFDVMNKEINKKKNKGRLDLGSHGNKDIFIEVDSDQYEPGNNSNKILKNRTNKCSKLLIDRVTPYITDSYLTQNDINPYYSIKTFNNYEIKRPFNNKKRNKKNNNNQNIKNDIIPYKSLELKRLNNLSSSSNEKIKYPLVISLKNQNLIRASQNSNLSNYNNEEANDYFLTLSDNSKGEKNENKKEKKFNYTSYNDSNKEQIFIDKNSDEEQDYKDLYLKKEKQYNNLLKEYNDIISKFNNNYMINNYKKLNINKNNNNKFVKNSDNNNYNKSIKIINLNSIHLKGKQKIRKYMINKINDINIISSKNNKKIFDEKFLTINKLKDFKLLFNDKINSKQDSIINNNKCFEKISSLKEKENEIKNSLEHEKIISFYIEGSKKYLNYNQQKGKKNGFLLLNKKNGILNNTSIEVNDILDEINLNKSTKIKSNNKINHHDNENILTKIRNKKFNLNKFINKNGNKTKAEIIEKNIERIIDKNIYLPDNNNFYYSEEGNNFENLPDISSIINRLHFSVIKRKKINEDELN